ncbi:MAG: calcium-binding protein [Rhodobacteraceae bacterium]|nr:calcium-binding protein [Paracoccaceae bacterium]
MASIIGTPQSDYIAGTTGDDTIDGMGGGDIIDAGLGNDLIHGASGADAFVFGLGEGSDTITGFESGLDTIVIRNGAGSFTDLTIVTVGSSAVITFGDVSITVDGTGGVLSADDFSFGMIEGDNTNNKIYDFAGLDYVTGLGGNDVIKGRDGSDKLFGGDGKDKLFGDQGDDFLWGDTGNDRVNGGSGDDLLRGGDGDDRLNGGSGDDVLIGGTGADIFIFPQSRGSDHIKDFEDGIDLIQWKNGPSDLADITITTVGAHVVLEYAGETLTLRKFDAALLDNSDFDFG